MSPKIAFDKEILDELNRILSSPEFANAGRVGQFLRHSVERTLAGDREGLKESVIGSEVYGRPPGYDTKADPIVRTEARRLRLRLDEYLARVQPTEVRITMPKGGYVAEFEVNAPAPAPAPAEPLPAPPLPLPARRRGVWIAAAGVLVVAVAAVLMLRTGNRGSLPTFSTLTSYPGFQFNPSLSPDGTEVVFVWTGEQGGPAKVHIASVNGGTPRRLTSGGASEAFPVWSPDGGRIAFVRRGEGLILATARGGEERILVKSAYASQLDWSPDGKHIAFCAFPPGSDDVALYVADSLTANSRQFPKTERGQFPAYSPDGTQIAFARCSTGNCDVYLMPAQGGEPRQITRQRSPIAGITWNPDGNQIVFASRRMGPWTLWQVAANGSSEPNLVPVAGEDIRYPRFAPKRSGTARLVYEQAIDDSNIWSQALETNQDGPVKFAGEPRRLVSSTRIDSSPQISPDGRRMAFVSTRSGFEELWTVDINGGNPVQVTKMRAPALGSPRWSPDSGRISFDAVGPEGRAIFVIGATGGTPTQWSTRKVSGRTSWSHDGRWLYFGEFDDKRVTQLLRVSTSDPGQRTVLTTDGGFEAFESEDAGTLYYIRERELRRMPRDGGPSTQVKTGSLMAHGWWGLGPGGVYFVDMLDPTLYSVPPISKGAKKVIFVDVKSGERRQIGAITGDMIGVFPDFCVAPDGKHIYFSLLEVSVSQIRMMEGGF